MASYRRDRVNDETLREMVEIVRDVKDPRINSAFVSITHCDVTPDLKFAKVYYSVMDGDAGEVGKGLKSASGFIRRQLALRLNMRMTPQLEFIHDNSMEHGAHISKLLKDIASTGEQS